MPVTVIMSDTIIIAIIITVMVTMAIVAATLTQGVRLRDGMTALAIIVSGRFAGEYGSACLSRRHRQQSICNRLRSSSSRRVFISAN